MLFMRYGVDIFNRAIYIHRENIRTPAAVIKESCHGY